MGDVKHAYYESSVGYKITGKTDNDILLAGGGSIATSNFLLATTAYGIYEPKFTKNGAFNKDFGTTAGTIAEGNILDTLKIGGRNLLKINELGRYSGGNILPKTGAFSVTDYVIDVVSPPGDLVATKVEDLRGATKLTISGYTTLVGASDYYFKFDNQGQSAVSVTAVNGRFEYTLNIPTGATSVVIGIGGYPFTAPFTMRDVKVEKGNKATDWTPAPEDQISDWETVDTNSFSFIKNKPNLSVYALNSALANYVTANGVQTIYQTKTFDSSPIIPNGTLASHAVNKSQLDQRALADGSNATNAWLSSSYALEFNPTVVGKTMNAGGLTNLSNATYGSVAGIVNNNGTGIGTPTDDWYHRIKMLHNNVVGYYTEIAVAMTGTEAMYYKQFSGGSSIKGWIRVHDTQTISSTMINSWNDAVSFLDNSSSDEVLLGEHNVARTDKEVQIQDGALRFVPEEFKFYSDGEVDTNRALVHVVIYDTTYNIDFRSVSPRQTYKIWNLSSDSCFINLGAGFSISRYTMVEIYISDNGDKIITNEVGIGTI